MAVVLLVAILAISSQIASAIECRKQCEEDEVCRYGNCFKARPERLDNLLTMPGVKCAASSYFPAYVCENAYNGKFEATEVGSWASKGEDTGAWLEFTFPHEVFIQTSEVWSRCNMYDQYKGVKYIFDGSSKSADLTCKGTGDWRNCAGMVSDRLSLGGILTTKVRMEFMDSCRAGGNPGVREVKLSGMHLLIDQPTTNIMKAGGITCKASSMFPNYSCDKVYDGGFGATNVAGSWASLGQDTGAWLEFTFPKPYFLTSVEIWSRCIIRDQYKGVTFKFDDGSSQTMPLTCSNGNGGGNAWTNCDGNVSDKKNLAGVLTKSARLDFQDSCAAGGNPGVREVVFNGYAGPATSPGGNPVNIMKEGGITCKASSMFPNYSCDKVYDGGFGATNVAGSWASLGQDIGAWLEFTFPRPYRITSVEVWSRCITRDQYKGVTFKFDDGSTQTMTLTCADGAGGANAWTSCVGNVSDKFDLVDVTTRHVRLDFLPSCAAGGNPGVREIAFNGY